MPSSRPRADRRWRERQAFSALEEGEDGPAQIGRLPRQAAFQALGFGFVDLALGKSLERLGPGVAVAVANQGEESIARVGVPALLLGKFLDGLSSPAVAAHLRQVRDQHGGRPLAERLHEAVGHLCGVDPGEGPRPDQGRQLSMVFGQALQHPFKGVEQVRVSRAAVQGADGHSNVFVTEEAE